jgi:hypothetical protein
VGAKGVTVDIEIQNLDETLDAFELDRITTFNMGLEFKMHIEEQGIDTTKLRSAPLMGIDLVEWAESNDLPWPIVSLANHIQETEAEFFSREDLLLINRRIIETVIAKMN